MNIYTGSTLLDSISNAFSKVMTGLSPIGPFVAAIVIFLVGKFVAGKIKDILVKVLSKTSLDERFGKLIGNNAGVSNIVANIVHALLLIFVVTLALSKAGMGEAVEPLKNMLNDFIGFIPNILGAGVLGFIAIFGAKIVKNLLENVFMGAKLDERLGSEPGTTPISKAISTSVFCFIILFLAPAILETLGLKQISEPITAIVNKITGAVPNIVIAAVVLGIGFLIAQIAQKLVKNLLDATGANALPAKVGLDIPQEGNRSVSSVVSYVVMLSIVVIIVSQAIELLKLPLLTELSAGLVGGYLNVLAAVIIFGFGLLASKFAFEKLSDKNLTLAKVARIGILVLTGVVALQRSAIAPELTGLPFVTGVVAIGFAVGVGGAIALGLGGKDYVSRWFEKKG